MKRAGLPEPGNPAQRNFGRSTTLDVRVEHLLDFAFANRANALFDYLAALEEQQGGDAADVVPHGSATVCVHVEFADLSLTGVLAGHYIDGGRHLAARTAPLGPKIHQDRDLGAEHILIERRIGKT